MACRGPSRGDTDVARVGALSVQSSPVLVQHRAPSPSVACALLICRVLAAVMYRRFASEPGSATPQAV